MVSRKTPAKREAAVGRLRMRSRLLMWERISYHTPWANVRVFLIPPIWEQGAVLL
jgi:hypothetical protein